jgi:hypothetical protein
MRDDALVAFRFALVMDTFAAELTSGDCALVLVIPAVVPPAPQTHGIDFRIVACNGCLVGNGERRDGGREEGRKGEGGCKIDMERDGGREEGREEGRELERETGKMEGRRRGEKRKLLICQLWKDLCAIFHVMRSLSKSMSNNQSKGDCEAGNFVPGGPETRKK